MPKEVAAMIDERLLLHWQFVRKAREQARASLPSSWREDPRPKMDEVREMYIEGMPRMNGSSPVAAINDDR
jgi:hypothetical protein